VSPDSAALLRLAESIADGSAVDWESEETRAGDEERDVIRQLRVVSELAALHRSLPSAPLETGPAASVAPPPPAIGTWGHLVLLERLGGGAFGEVYRAWDEGLQRAVALKLLRAGRPDDPETSRLVQEGRHLARVRHPNVVTVHGVAVHEGFGALQRARVLAHHVAGQRQEGPGQLVLPAVQLDGAQIAQAAQAQEARRALAAGPALVVGGIAEIAARGRVQDDHDRPGRQRPRRGDEVAAIDEQRVAVASSRHDELVHDAALHAHPAVLRALGEARGGHGVPLEVGGGEERTAGRDLQGGG